MSEDHFNQPHLLGVQGLSKEAVLSLLKRADAYADINTQRREVPRTLRDKTLINLFFENSTRTQASFELAAKRLGATVLNMSVKGSSVSKGETLIDTATTLNAMLPDILVVRHSQSGAVALLAEKVACSVVNAGDGWHEHPTQALLDALTIQRAFRARRGASSAAARLEGLTIAICGDVLHSRVARSNIFLHAALGNHVRLAGPPVLAPPAMAELGAEVCGSIAEAAEGADVVMMLRLQQERMDSAEVASLREYYNQYGLKEPLLAGAAQDALVMHPGPMNRGVEIDSELADDSERSVISEQVEMGVAMRLAVLQALADHGPPPAPRRDVVAGAAALGRFPRRQPGSVKSDRPTAFVNALLIDPDSGREVRGGLVMRDEKIADLGPHIGAEIGGLDLDRHDCGGAALAPGLVDMRCFIGEPGARHKESFGSGGEAAVAGGVTTIVTQPATDPAVDDPAVLDFIKKRVSEESEDHAMPHVKTMAALTKGLAGAQMTEFAFLQLSGAVGLSDGDRVIADSAVLRRCMETARSLDMLVCLQTQDPDLSRLGAATEGLFALKRGLPGAPVAAETITLARDLSLAALTGVKYHAAQISTEGSLELLAQAREKGVDVTASVSVAHFALSEEDIGDYRTFFKVNPPLRSKEDRAAMVAALASGAIDCVSSSHKPQDEDSKRQPYEAAATGAVGLETMLSALLGLRREAGMSLADVLRLATINPARRLGLESGRLAVGAPADLVLFDPDRPRLIDRRKLRSKSKNSPFHRAEMTGHVLRTVVAGRTVYVGAEAD